MSHRILFIDDEAEILKAYKALFQVDDQMKNTQEAVSAFLEDENILAKAEVLSDSVEYEVLTASNGLDGVKVVEQSLKDFQPIKVAFIDMRMPPGIDGCETAQRIRKLDSRIEIVFVTAFSDIKLDEIVEKIGSPDKILYLKKPFANEEIKQFALNLTVKYMNNQIKESFLSNVSHELKTPLSSILGFADILMEEELNEEQREHLEILYKNAKLMQVLINDLFQMSEITYNKLIIKKEDICLNEILEDVYKMISVRKSEEDVDLSFEAYEQKLMINADKHRVVQCLVNLINNAIKFTKEGEVRVWCELNEMIEVHVRDTGIGMSELEQQKIFEKFYRIENESHFKPGLGLGLAIVDEIMKAHGGEIKVISKINEGSEFILYFQK